MVHKFLKKLKPVEVTLSAISGYWGVMLLLPFDTFATSPAYDKMANLASESNWGIFMLLVSLYILLGMLIGHFRMRRIGLLFSTANWLFVSSMLFMGSPSSTGGGCYFIFAVLSSWAYMKVGEQRYGR
ncbi:hypothetical protein ACP26L_36275 (plasmid) [Paenibacillus sp. S-38]|uniref:hypothetical protein n=1 Tax=Paenibacillus sp. S-38 TaxID=3416710 RepID=UPI003CEC71D2